ncbi:hypothetical protein [Paraflavitalea speifideaquila]|uniref:hypothetical protein n=1 Tax=Paraflavitalea speifideaquila TaxID=3076558 RepID=UPI003313005F
MGDTPLESTTGFTIYQANTAALVAKGAELTLETRNIIGKINWTTLLLLSFTTHKVTRYLQSPAEASTYVNPSKIVPRVQYPLDGLYSYAWAGLDPQYGNPQGFLEGKPSTQYAHITTARVSTLIYEGQTTPPFLVPYKILFKPAPSLFLACSPVRSNTFSGNLL